MGRLGGLHTGMDGGEGLRDGYNPLLVLIVKLDYLNRHYEIILMIFF